MNPQLEGIEKLTGTYLFDLERSAKTLRLNRFLHDLIFPEKRALFKEDPDAAFDKAGLTAQERTLVRELDWRAMIHYGASFSPWKSWPA